jgi:hypothetical protein
MMKIILNSVAGSRATEACEPRQVRKEAAAAMSAMCCGKPGHQCPHPLASASFGGIVVGFLNVLIIRLRGLLLAASLSFATEWGWLFTTLQQI